MKPHRRRTLDRLAQVVTRLDDLDLGTELQLGLFLEGVLARAEDPEHQTHRRNHDR